MTSARYVLLLLMAALLAGCGGSRPEVAPVGGRVTLDGEPLAGARIRFQPEASGGSPSYGTTNQDGDYQLGYTRDQAGPSASNQAVTKGAGTLQNREHCRRATTRRRSFVKK